MDDDACPTCGEHRTRWHRCEHCGSVPIERLHDLCREEQFTEVHGDPLLRKDAA